MPSFEAMNAAGAIRTTCIDIERIWQSTAHYMWQLGICVPFWYEDSLLCAGRRPLDVRGRSGTDPFSRGWWTGGPDFVEPA
jgi:hypothetical protein